MKKIKIKCLLEKIKFAIAKYDTGFKDEKGAYYS